MLSDIMCFLQEKFQHNFLPFVEEQFDSPVLEKHQKVLWALEVIQIERAVPIETPFTRGRPRKHHRQIARAFVAKHVLNLPTTDMLIHVLKVDKHLRYICGWEPNQTLPSASTFSRVFQEFASSNILEKLHADLITEVLQDDVVPHAITDSMPIPAKEKPKKRETKEKPLRGKDTVAYRQAHNDLPVSEMLELVPTVCTTGRKKKSNGNSCCWNGYKLHACSAEGKFIISAAISSASAHDGLAVIPLIKMSSTRTTVLYDLMDTAYDDQNIRNYVSSLGRVPLIKKHPRKGKTKEAVLAERKAQKTIGWKTADVVRQKRRAIGERVFARLSAGFSTLSVFVKGAEKVKTHVFLSILTHTADELYRGPT